MKKIFKFAAIVAATAALFSCQEKPTPEPTPDPEKPDQEQPGQTELNENIKFTIEFTEATENSAKFRVEHDGARTDTWHYFATTQSDIAAAIETEAAALAANGKSPQASTGKNVTVRGLEAETAYTFVVFGVTKKGEVYGEPATLAFETTAEPIEGFQVNPAWTVSYIGDYEYQGQVLEHVVAVESTDNNPYFTTAWPKEFFDQTPIETIAENEIAAWLEYLTPNGMTMDEILSYESSLSQVSIDTQYGTEWYIIAIGADSKGNATGYYAVSELVTFTEEELSAGYAAWLGDWTFTGSNGISQTVKFSKGAANKTFKMSGYEGQNLEVIVNWSEEDQCWQINNQFLGTYNFSGGSKGDIWFVGEDAEGALFLSDQLPICIGGMLEDGTLACAPFEGELEFEGGNTYPYAVADMLFLADFGVDPATGEQQLSYISDTFKTGYPTFPMTITPATKATTNAVKEFTGMKKSINNFKMFETFGVKNAMIL